MNITLNNYEEYFLLLADAELTPTEEVLVQQFVAQHPHLQEELALLMACRLDATEIPVFPKEKLLRTTTWDIENPEPIHTQLITLLDNELPAAQVESLKQQIAISPALQTEWNRLQQTKLAAEAITYPDKKELYHQRSIRPLVWMRWAAAAAVLAVAWLFWPTEKNLELGAGVASAVFQKEPSTSSPVPSKKVDQQAETPALKPDNISTADATPKQLLQKGTRLQQKQETNTGAAIALTKKNKVRLKKESVPVVKEEVVTPEPEILALNESQTTTLENHHSLITPLSESEDITIQTAKLTPKNITIASESFQNTMAVNTLAANEEKFVHIAGARIDKQKMRGLFRGITRSVTRTFSKSKMKPAESAYATRN